MTEILRMSHSLDQGYRLRAAILVLSAWAVCRFSATGPNAPIFVAILVVGLTANSLVFLMPDTETLLMVLCGGAGLAFACGMLWWKICVCRVVEAFAKVEKLLHPVVALLRVSGSVAVTACLSCWRNLFPVLLVALLISASIAEKTNHKMSVDKSLGNNFIHRSFHAADPIQGGLGLTHFSSHCLAWPIATCVLQDAPTSTISEPSVNVLQHGRMFRVDMTLAPLGQIRKSGSLEGLELGEFGADLKAKSFESLIWATTLLAAVYVLSTTGVLGLPLWPENVPRERKALTFGVGCVALESGEMPQPALCFGVRTMWLLLATLAFLGLFRALSPDGPWIKQAQVQAVRNR